MMHMYVRYQCIMYNVVYMCMILRAAPLAKSYSYRYKSFMSGNVASD